MPVASAGPVTRNVYYNGYDDPFTHNFPAEMPKEEQDAEILRHKAGLDAARGIKTLGPQGALAQLLVSAQQTLTPKPEEEEGPKVIRGATAWGLTPNQITDSFTALSNRQAQQQELELRKAEQQARRQQALVEMQQELDMAEKEQQFNLKLKDMEHTQRLNEKQKEHDDKTLLEETKAKSKLELEKTKASLKPKKLVSAYDPKTGQFTLQPEEAGLITKVDRSPEEIANDAFSYATDLMNYEFVDEASGERQPMDFLTASAIANEAAQGKKVNLDYQGIKLVKKENPNLVPVVDGEGATTLQPKKAGMETKPAPEPKRSEVTSEFNMAYQIAKDSLKEAKTALDNMPTSPEEDGYDAAKLNKVKASVEAASEEVQKTRKRLNDHLNKQEQSGSEETVAPTGGSGSLVDDGQGGFVWKP